MRHLLLVILLALASCGQLAGALPFTDSFSNTDGTVLTTHNSAWAMNTGTAGIRSSAAISTTAGALFLARVTGETFSDDQYAQCTVRNPVDNYAMAVAVRVAPSANTNYHVLWDTNQLVLRKTVAGTNSTLADAGSISMTDGTVVRLQIVGNALSVFLNGSGTATLSYTDSVSPITTGVPGLRGFDYSAPGSAQNRCDDYEAGNYSAGSSSRPPRRTQTYFNFFVPVLGAKQ